METQTQQRPANAALTNILNKDEPTSTKSAPPPQLRDSGFYSTTEASSKRPFLPFPTLPLCLAVCCLRRTVGLLVPAPMLTVLQTLPRPLSTPTA